MVVAPAFSVLRCKPFKPCKPFRWPAAPPCATLGSEQLMMQVQPAGLVVVHLMQGLLLLLLLLLAPEERFLQLRWAPSL